MIVDGKIDQMRDAHNAAVEQINNTHATALATINEKMNLHIKYMKELAEDESNRIKEVRKVDTEAVSIASESTVKRAEVLAIQVQQTATTLSQQLTVVTAQLIERIAALEKAQYENIGKLGASPDIPKMVADLVEASNIAKGKSGISNQVMFIIVGAVTSVITAIIFLALKL
jgi:hypothetical protein